MPKQASYVLAWCPAQQTYVLSMPSDAAPLPIEPGTPAWFAWLEHVPSSDQSVTSTKRLGSSGAVMKPWSAIRFGMAADALQ